VCLCLLLAALGCAASRSGETPKPTPAAPRRVYSLAAYLPPTGLKLALGVWPRALLADAELGPLLLRLVTETRIRAFQISTGVNLQLLEEAWLAEYELGKLYLVPSRHAEEAGITFLEHSESHKLERTYAEGLESYSALRARVPHFLVTDRGRFTAVVEGDPTLGRLVAARSLGKLDALPPALARSGFEKLPPLGTPLAALFWAGSVDVDDETSPSNFAESAQTGRVTLIRHEHGVGLEVAVLSAALEDPTPEWTEYLRVLGERPELRAAFGESAEPKDPRCRFLEPYWLCEAQVQIRPELFINQWGRLLNSGLDAF
jgi:hypothetical protein